LFLKVLRLTRTHFKGNEMKEKGQLTVTDYFFFSFFSHTNDGFI